MIIGQDGMYDMKKFLKNMQINVLSQIYCVCEILRERGWYG